MQNTNLENTIADLAFNRIQLLAIISTVVLMLIISYLIAKRRLRTEYAIVWSVWAFLLFVVSLRRDWLEQFAQYLQVYYAPSLLFMVLIMTIIVYCLHLSLELSKTREQVKNLAQAIAIYQLKEKESI